MIKQVMYKSVSLWNESVEFCEVRTHGKSGIAETPSSGDFLVGWLDLSAWNIYPNLVYSRRVLCGTFSAQ